MRQVFDVYQQLPPARWGGGEKPEYRANLHLLGSLEARNGSDAIDLAKILWPHLIAPVVAPQPRSIWE